MKPGSAQQPHISAESLQVIEEMSNPSKQNYFTFAFMLALIGATVYGLFALLELSQSVVPTAVAFANNSSDLVNAKCSANGTTFLSNTTNSVFNFVDTECGMYNSFFFDRSRDNSTLAKQLNITLTCLEVIPSLCQQWYRYDAIQQNSGLGFLLSIIALPTEAVSFLGLYLNFRHLKSLKKAIKDDTILNTIIQELQSFKILLLNKTGREIKDTLKQNGVTLNETGFSKLFNLFSSAPCVVWCSQRISEVTVERGECQQLI